MRPLEILLSCVASAGAAFLLAGSPPGWPVVVSFLVVLGGLTAAHLIYEGAHWQLAPLYLGEAALFAFVIVVLPVTHAFGLQWTIARWGLRLSGGLLLLLVLAAALLSWMLPMFRLPKPKGPNKVGTRILHVIDPMRDAEGGRRAGSQRELMVQLWYPAEPVGGRREVYRRRSETTFKSSYQSVLRTQSLRDAPVLASNAPYPLLIFNPAWTGQRTQSTFLMQELASHGYVVASIDHTYYSGRVAFPDGRVFDGHMAPALGDFTYLSIEEGIELADQFVRILAEDIVSVLDELGALNSRPDSDWYRCLDMSRVGALGHSIGGAAAAEACSLDPRILAALNLDGWTFGEVLRHGLAKPWMVIYGKGIEVEPRDLAAQSEGMQRYWQMNRENYAAVEAALHRHGGCSLTIRGASHWNFSDRPLYSPLRFRTQAGTIRPELAHRIVGDAVRAFFGESLPGGEPGFLAEVIRDHPEVSGGC
jgi:pimeloyl-ACP methyl ester carboxylesterase